MLFDALIPPLFRAHNLYSPLNFERLIPFRNLKASQAAINATSSTNANQGSLAHHCTTDSLLIIAVHGMPSTLHFYPLLHS
jgi:hypothetical protein